MPSDGSCQGQTVQLLVTKEDVMMLQKTGLSTGLLVASTLATAAQTLSALNPDVGGAARPGLVTQNEAPAIGVLNENAWDFTNPRGVPGFGPMTIEDAQQAMAHITQTARPDVPRK
jgi:hypothetical protein